MTEAYYHLVRTAPVLQALGSGHPADLVAKMPTASSGESVMIAAALSLIPGGWLEDLEIEVPEFGLNDVGSLDPRNARALIEAVAIATGYPEVAYGN